MSPEKARSIANKAIKSGILVRPIACTRCGSEPGLASDGRSKIQAHHHDYSQPLDVEWLCAKCHRAETPLPAVMGAPNFGDKNGTSRLTSEQVRTIKKSELGCRRLAAIYGVDKRTIQRVRNGTHWKEVE